MRHTNELTTLNWVLIAQLNDVAQERGRVRERDERPREVERFRDNTRPRRELPECSTPCERVQRVSSARAVSGINKIHTHTYKGINLKTHTLYILYVVYINSRTPKPVPASNGIYMYHHFAFNYARGTDNWSRFNCAPSNSTTFESATENCINLTLDWQFQ